MNAYQQYMQALSRDKGDEYANNTSIVSGCMLAVGLLMLDVREICRPDDWDRFLSRQRMIEMFVTSIAHALGIDPDDVNKATDVFVADRTIGTLQ